MSRRLRRVGGVGAVAAGVLVAVALGNGMAGAQEPGLVISPDSGPPGTTIAVSGTGCTPTDPGGAVTVTAVLAGAGVTHDSETTTPEEGAWSVSLQVRADAQPGSQLTITAVCNGGSIEDESATFSVTGPPTTTTTTTTPPSTTTTSTPSTTTTAPPSPGPGRTGPPAAGAPAAPPAQAGLSVALMPPATPVVAEPVLTG